jgi:hypothetical protein
MRLQFTKSCGINLWQLLLAIAAFALVLAMLPERIGVPIFLGFEGTLTLALIIFLAIWALRKLRR